ncbi:class I SAM-dependent methyltransferase [Brevibacterium album]|uniref:class I SAM-dependent methyltransferase n=1 Tax=Brevibacterium album TaxID=417948 RepID=UPI0003FF9E66|nr:class I SAM-dependent methyltransferase [Brevibacterium album]
MSAPQPRTSSGGAAEDWESTYLDSPRLWSGEPNAALVSVVSSLPGPDAAAGRTRCLDLGSGEGADALWLAGLGWQVTGLDIAPTAVARARETARGRGFSPQQADFRTADLTVWEPEDAEFGLVTVSYLHMPEHAERISILRAGLRALAPGGRLVSVAHVSAPPWADPHAQPWSTTRMPEQELEHLALDWDDWQVEEAGLRMRTVTGPDGTGASLDDGVLVVRRRA